MGPGKVRTVLAMGVGRQVPSPLRGEMYLYSKQHSGLVYLCLALCAVEELATTPSYSRERETFSVTLPFLL